MDDLKKYIGEKIKIYRKNLKMTTSELGALSETSQSTISGIERGERFANFDAMIRICDALGITLYDVLPPKNLDSHEDEVNSNLDRFNTYLKRLSSDEIDLAASLVMDHMSLLKHIHGLDPRQKKNLTNLLDSLLNN